jgi:AraC-like DNA-binding protein
MRLIHYRPAVPLDSYVECFWWSRRDTPESTWEYMLPSGNAQMIFALHESPIVCLPTLSCKAPIVWSRGVVHGPQWNYFVSGPKPCGAVAGVSFRPGAAGVVLGVPITEITDRHVTINELWGARGPALRERLLQAGAPSAVFRILEQELTERLKRPLLIHPAIAYALDPHVNGWVPRRVRDIQRETGYSSRHFIALFRAAVGLTPKHYFRVKRFTAVLQRLAASNKASLADIASSVGYSDQSHLTREFRDFAGITPTQYRPRGPKSVFHHQTQDSLRVAPTASGKKTSRRPQSSELTIDSYK